MAGEAVAQGVRGGPFGNPGPAYRFLDRLLHQRLVQMIAPMFAGIGHGRQLHGRKQPLPPEFLARAVFLPSARAKTSPRNRRPSPPRGAVRPCSSCACSSAPRLAAAAPCDPFVPCHRARSTPSWRNSILPPQLQALEQAQAAPVQQFRHQHVRRIEPRDDAIHFFPRQHDRDRAPSLGPDHALDFAEFPFEYVPEQKQQRVEGLVLAGCRDVLMDRPESSKNL